ncbi:D-amino acid dehydrogenase (plasmid) [Cupriavidus necator H850]|uniref:NAD(P)/FAD-dependent oxidoreductase n=1 Tax=Cupriavidus necator TaxID=106590 RepID=UPI001E5B3DD1|nr:D-amino acid dehydrogenase [Cupriavidus necator H850]
MAGRFSHGLLFPDWRFVSDTEGFIAALTDSFVAGGGRRIRTNAARIEDSAGRATGVTLENGERIRANHVVVTAGTGSRKFFPQLGVSVPLEGIAGYQALLTHLGRGNPALCHLRRRRLLLCAHDTRAANWRTIEFAGRDAKPNFKRAEITLAKAKRILPELL